KVRKADKRGPEVDSPQAKTEGEKQVEKILSPSHSLRCASPLVRGRLDPAAGLGKAKAFWNHTVPVVFFLQQRKRSIRDGALL
ncbi:MAG: hypothetical protein IKJ94_02460, partial [Oscillospiraceae bacterium]|nr:hypothetical protein [Oscillospiraceae bacterium]